MRLFAANLHGTLCCRSVLFPVESSTRNYRGKGLIFLLYFSMSYRDFSVKSKLIVSLFQTVKLSLSISLFQKNRIFVT